MDESILYFFDKTVLHAYTTSTWSTIPAVNKNENILRLISRIASLHSTRTTSDLPPATTIAEGLAIWHDLQEWKPPDDDIDGRVYTAYSSALFIWLYLLIHPDGIGDEKVQNMVREGMEDMQGVAEDETVPFLVIPVFLHGIACVEGSERESIKGLFKKLYENEKDIDPGYKNVVEKSWKAFDNGVRRSWDVGFGR